MPSIPRAHRLAGRYAETSFDAWLNESELAFMVIDQTPLTLPKHLRGVIKRPDRLIGILSVGVVAVDVKARTVTDGCVLIQVDEHDSFVAFEQLFGIPVWYACYRDRNFDTCLLFRNMDLSLGYRMRVRTTPCFAFPIELATAAEPARLAFDTALMRASRERLCSSGFA